MHLTTLLRFHITKLGTNRLYLVHLWVRSIFWVVSELTSLDAFFFCKIIWITACKKGHLRSAESVTTWWWWQGRYAMMGRICEDPSCQNSRMRPMTRGKTRVRSWGIQHFHRHRILSLNSSWAEIPRSNCSDLKRKVGIFLLTIVV